MDNKIIDGLLIKARSEYDTWGQYLVECYTREEIQSDLDLYGLEGVIKQQKQFHALVSENS